VGRIICNIFVTVNDLTAILFLSNDSFYRIGTFRRSRHRIEFLCDIASRISRKRNTSTHDGAILLNETMVVDNDISRRRDH